MPGLILFFRKAANVVRLPLMTKVSVQSVILVVILCLVPYGFYHYSLKRGVAEHFAADTAGGLGVKDLVRRVKSELSQAENEMARNHETALFELKDFQMEISFVVQERSTEKGTVEYHFVTVEGEHETGLEKIQKLNLHWAAIPPQKSTIPSAQGPISADPDSPISYGTIPPVRKGVKP